ncbi:MAG: hypothetical protein ACTSYD_00960 [Candidatus Heimdallarchaeaceae archaeon]
MKDLLEYKNQFLIWKQKKNPIFISIFELPLNLSDSKYESLMMELINKNTVFSLFINTQKIYLILYGYGGETKRFNDLIEKFGLIRPSELKNFFMSNFNKIQKETKDEIVSVDFSDGNTTKFYKVYLLSSGFINKKSNEFLENLIKTEVFSIIISFFPERKFDNTKSHWGLLIVLDGNSIDHVKSKDKLLIQIIKTTQVSLNWQLTAISKTELLAHKANFRLFVPWKKISTNYSTIKELFLQKFTRYLNTGWDASIKKKVIEDKPIEPERGHYKVDTKPLLPHPSVKQLKKVEKTSTTIDLTVPLPFYPHKNDNLNNQSNNNELVKIRILNGLKQYDFKSTVLFQDSFDLVLRNGSFYVFIKVIDGILNVNKTYQIIDQLSSIAGLRDKFLCIVVADYIEDKAISISRGYPILCLVKQEVTSELMIVTKIREHLDLFITTPVL